MPSWCQFIQRFGNSPVIGSLKHNFPDGKQGQVDIRQKRGTDEAPRLI